MKTYVSPSFIKQLARQIGQSESIKLSFALDKAVRQYGYSNYRNYLNLLEEGREAKRDLLKKVALENNSHDKVALVMSFAKERQISFADFFDTLKLFERSDDRRYFDFENYGQYLAYLGGINPIQYLCENINTLEPDIISCLLDNFRTPNGQCSIEDFYEYYVAKDITLSDIYYEFQDDVIFVDCNYKLLLEPDFEDPDGVYHDKNHDYSLEGNCELEFDGDKKMIIVECSIGNSTQSYHNFIY